MSKYKLTISGKALINLIPTQPEDGYEEGTKVTINVANGNNAVFKQFTGGTVVEVINAAVYEIIMDEDKTITVEEKSEEDLKKKDIIIQYYDEKYNLGSGKLKFQVIPADAELTYESSNTDILEVTDGEYTAKQVGKVVITINATKEGYLDKSYSRFIDVYDSSYNPADTTLEIIPDEIYLNTTGEKKVLVKTNAKEFFYELLDLNPKDAVTAEKQSDGILLKSTKNGTGKLKIRAKADKGVEVYKEASITVKALSPVAFNLNPATGDVSLNEIKEVEITGLTSGATWRVESKNPEFVSVKVKDETHFIITPIKEGEFTIDVIGEKDDMTSTTKQYTGNVTAAKQLPVEFTLNPESGNVTMGQTKKVTIEGLTEGATFEVESKNTDTATVQKGESDFTITPIKPGPFTIDVTGKKDGMTDTKKSYTGTVEEALKKDFTSLVINDSTFTKGSSGKISVTSDPTGEGVTYEYNSSAPEKMTVDGEGNYNAIEAGTTNLTVTAKKEGYNDKSEVKEITITE